MKFTGASFSEVEPGRYLIEGGFRSKAFESHLGQWGWKFEEQMGAGLTYTRGQERLQAYFFGCGPGFCLVELHNDPVTGSTLKQQKPWNLFR